MLLVLTAYPLVQVVQMSFYEYDNSQPVPTFSGLANYAAILQDKLFWASFRNTLLFAVGSVAIHVAAGLGVALLLRQHISPRVRAVFRSIFLFPWLFASAVVAANWYIMLNPFGIINYMLKGAGLLPAGPVAWLADPRWAMAALLVTNGWRGFPFIMLMLLAGLMTIPAELYEAAMVDGANAYQRFRFITIPRLRGVLATVITLDFIWSFRSFDLVFLMTGGGPMNVTELLSTYVYNVAFRSWRFGYAGAISVVMLVLLLGASFWYTRASLKEGGS